MVYFIQQTLVYCIPLMIVALAGVFAERSGIINIALEGIMVFGAFMYASDLFKQITLPFCFLRYSIASLLLINIPS